MAKSTSVITPITVTVILNNIMPKSDETHTDMANDDDSNYNTNN
ncbi:3521_t:CDS:1, partial [Cetraspora pellucida]